MSIPLPPSDGPTRWPAEAIWQAVEPSLPGFTVEVLPEIDSTNSELMRRFRAASVGHALPSQGGAVPGTEPILLVAERQSAGRGRRGRAWASQVGASLTFSLGMPLQRADWSGLSLAVGCSVADSLDALAGQHPSQPGIGLKWPNDLWLTAPALGLPHVQQTPGSVAPTYPGKLGGILVETVGWEGLRYVVIGVGLNISPVHVAADAQAAVPPAWLQALDPEATAAATLLRVAPALVRAVQDFEAHGFSAFQARFAARDVLQGLQVQLSDGRTGTAQGVSAAGALQVQSSTGLEDITSAEVSVRPVLSPAPASLPPSAAFSRELLC